MSQVVTQDHLSSEWLTAKFPLETQRVDDVWRNVGWNIASRNSAGIVTRLRVLETGVESFIAECAQAEAGLDEVPFCGGVGIPVETAEHLDQLVAALRLEYSR